jgi:hypothetical protein
VADLFELPAFGLGNTPAMTALASRLAVSIALDPIDRNRDGKLSPA